MNTEELEYHLPPERIAQHPLAERDASRMMLLDRDTGAREDRLFREFPDLLSGGELIVRNNARVIPARLFGRRKGVRAHPLGAHNPKRHEFLTGDIEVLLLRFLGANRWEALVRPGRKIPVGETIVFGDGQLGARVEARGTFGKRVLEFTCEGDFQALLAKLGRIPLPPYIKREDDPSDRERYQTIYAEKGTAIAAPTAGLHFSEEILERIRTRGIETVEVTLEVGFGTFEPVRTKRLEDHRIQAEAYEIPEAAAVAIERARRERRPILAIGTTVVRALEDYAEKRGFEEGGRVAPGRIEATIFLYPGKPFRVVNQLLTNFHLPKSSLLAMVTAFAGREQILAAYRHAVNTGYRFYSYGDCMLIR
jgi:S-adenosylmethionine:tRNA ribosyltransferase-isomerase